MEERASYLLENGFKAFVIFTRGGYEDRLANIINQKDESLFATPLYKLSHKSKNGEKTVERKVMLPGYVFVYMPLDYDSKLAFTYEEIHYRILDKDKELTGLSGEDLKYAEWVLELGGTIGMSSAIKLNGLVKIISGPLKDMEGKIVEYSKKNRNCKIEIEFAGRTIESWLPFEWVMEEREFSND